MIRREKKYLGLLSTSGQGRERRAMARGRDRDAADEFPAIGFVFPEIDSVEMLLCRNRASGEIPVLVEIGVSFAGIGTRSACGAQGKSLQVFERDLVPAQWQAGNAVDLFLPAGYDRQLICGACIGEAVAESGVENLRERHAIRFLNGGGERVLLKADIGRRRGE